MLPAAHKTRWHLPHPVAGAFETPLGHQKETLDHGKSLFTPPSCILTRPHWRHWGCGAVAIALVIAEVLHSYWIPAKKSLCTMIRRPTPAPLDICDDDVTDTTPALRGGNQSIVQILWRHRKMAVSTNKPLLIFMPLKVFTTFSKSAAARVFIVWLNHSLWILCQTPGWTLYPVGNIFKRWKGSEDPNISSRALLRKHVSLFLIFQPSLKKAFRKNTTCSRHDEDTTTITDLSAHHLRVEYKSQQSQKSRMWSQI